MSKEIKVIVNGRETSALPGMTLSEIIRGEKPCGGHGKCGKCRVVAKGALSEVSDAELKMLSTDEIVSGMRLACLTRALGDCEIATLTQIAQSHIVTEGELPEFEIKPCFKKYGVAIDVGTTTLAARLYDTEGRMIGDTARLNPQSEWGADVISRIEAAMGGSSKDLAASVRGALNEMLSTLSADAEIDPLDIDGVVITGNTVMLSLLSCEDVEPFSHAPFDAKRLFGESVLARELELSCLASDTAIYLPPCISAFVGADTTCAILATELCDGDTAMLADIGTNGEIAIRHAGRLTVCSTAAGPAFEGVGITMGMRGADGAIDKVSVVDGQLSAHVIGEGEPVGICGSGLVDAVAVMLELEAIDEVGYLEEDEFVIKAPVCITPKDIRMLQLAKSAICAGIVTLIKNENVKESDIAVLCIAGGFGNYLNKESAAVIGLLPRELAEKSRSVGNAALGGASMLLLNADIKEKAEKIAKTSISLDLSTDPVFSEQYMSGMMLEEIKCC